MEPHFYGNEFQIVLGAAGASEIKIRHNTTNKYQHIIETMLADNYL